MKKLNRLFIALTIGFIAAAGMFTTACSLEDYDRMFSTYGLKSFDGMEISKGPIVEGKGVIIRPKAEVRVIGMNVQEDYYLKYTHRDSGKEYEVIHQDFPHFLVDFEKTGIYDCVFWSEDNDPDYKVYEKTCSFEISIASVDAVE